VDVLKAIHRVKTEVVNDDRRTHLNVNRRFGANAKATIAGSNVVYDISTCSVVLSYLMTLRCMECQRGLATRKVSVCLSVCLSNAWTVTKRKKDQSRFLYHTKDHLA